MSEVDKDPSGMPNQQACGGGGSNATLDTETVVDVPKKDTVAYETYRKTLRSEKALKLQLEDANAEREALKQAKLEAEGKTQELNESLKQQLDELKTSRKREASMFINATLQAQLESEASKHGCIDSEALMNFADFEVLVEDVDETTFRASNEKVSAEIDRIKKAKSYLFQQSTPSINNGLPKDGKPKDEDYASALTKCTSQKELDAVRRKYGRL